jgi:hypothetical protein
MFESKFFIVRLYLSWGIKLLRECIIDELLDTKYDDNPGILGMDEIKGDHETTWTIAWTIKVYLGENLEKKLRFTYPGLDEGVVIDQKSAEKHLENYEGQFKNWINFCFLEAEKEEKGVRTK